MHRSDSNLHKAALPWYSFPSTRSTLDEVWADVAVRLRAAGLDFCPRQLDHTTPHSELLSSPALILSQCCGPELFLDQTANVLPVGAPVISACPVEPGKYYSYIVSRNGANLSKPRVAINSPTSHSGCSAIKHWLTANSIVDYACYESGSHAQSVRDVQAGRADLAATDALSWRFLNTEGLKILACSESVPAPPFITGRQSQVPGAILVEALDSAFRRHGGSIGIAGVIPVDRSDYRNMMIAGSLPSEIAHNERQARIFR